MISLTIMAMITTVAFTGLSIGVDGWKRGTRKIEDMDARATVERLLKRQLAVAYPMELPVKDQDKPSVLFRGTKNTIDFISDYSLMDGQADFRRIGYRFDGSAFQYNEKFFYGDTPIQERLMKTRQLATFQAVRFRYLAENEQEERIWVEEWEMGTRLPVAVEVRIDNDVMIVPLVNRR